MQRKNHLSLAKASTLRLANAFPLLLAGFGLFALLWAVLALTPARAEFRVPEPVSQVEDDSRISAVTASAASTQPGATTTYTVSVNVNEELSSGGELSVSFNYLSQCPEGSDWQQDCRFLFTDAIDVVGEPAGVEVNGAQSGNDGFNLRIEEGTIPVGTLTLTVSGVKNPNAGGAARVSARTFVEGDPEPEPCQENCQQPDQTYSDAIFLGDIAFLATVTYKDTSEPVQNTWVNVSSRDRWFGGSTDAFGQVAIAGPIPAGEYHVNVQPPFGVEGYISAERKITYSGSGRQDFSVQLAPAIKFVEFTVKYKDNNEVVDDCSIWVNSQSGEGGGFGQGKDCDSNGKARIPLQCGDFMSSLNPKWNQETQTNMEVDWVPDPAPTQFSIACNNTPETLQKNIFVNRADAVVKGKVVDSNGRALDGGWIDLRTDEGQGSGCNIGRSGSFSCSVQHGTYRLSIFPNDQALFFPEFKVTVKEGQTLDVGTKTAQLKDGLITGRVLDDEGNPITNLNVNTWLRDGQGWGWAQTNEEGRFSLAVFVGEKKGEWEVNIDKHGQEQSLINTEPPKICVISSKDKSCDVGTFRLKTPNATVTLQAVDENGDPLNINSWGYCRKGFGRGEEFSGPISRGVASLGIYVKEGETMKLTCGAWVEPSASVLLEAAKEITVGPGDDEVLSLTFLEPSSSIKVTVKDAMTGKVAKGVDGEAFVFSPENDVWRPCRLSENGTCTMRVVPGEYFAGANIRSEGWLSSHDQGNAFEVADGETVNRVVNAFQSDSQLNVTLLDPNGEKVDFGFVGFSNRFLVEDSFGGEGDKPADPEGTVIESGTDCFGGECTLEVISGTYEIFAFLPPELAAQNWMPPSAERFTTESGDSIDMTLQFREADAQATVNVTLDNEPVEHGFCWAWSETEGFSGNEILDGVATLPLVGGAVWHVGCDSFQGGDDDSLYRAAEQNVSVEEGAQITLDVALEKELFTVPQSFSQICDATAPCNLTLPDGSTISASANTFATEGNVTIICEPNLQATRTNLDRPFMYAWNCEAFDGDNNVIETFNNVVEMSLKFDPAVLERDGIAEDTLGGKWWDTSSNTWKAGNNVTVDTENNNVTFQITHFTDFAVVDSGTGSDTASTGPERNDLVITPWSKGGPQVAVWNKDGELLATWFAYGSDLRMGISTLVDDLDGNGRNEIVTVPGAGFSSQVRVFDGDNGTILSQFYAYDAAFKGGVNMTSYDLDGDGTKELIFVPKDGATSHVKVFDRNGNLLSQFTAFGAGYKDGALITASDLNGDGTGEIILAPVAGSGQVVVYDRNGALLTQFAAYGTGYKNGIASLVAADLDADGEVELITTPVSGGSQVKVFNRNGGLIAQFNAYGTGFTGGSRIAVGDVDGDGTLDIVALPNSNGSAQARVFTKDGVVKSQFFAYPETTRKGQFSADVADTDADGIAEIIFGTGIDLGPNVRVFNQNGEALSQFMALHGGFRGGINVNAISR